MVVVAAAAVVKALVAAAAAVVRVCVGGGSEGDGDNREGCEPMAYQRPQFEQWSLAWWFGSEDQKRPMVG